VLLLVAADAELAAEATEQVDVVGARCNQAKVVDELD
jgi:hypothetical protein